MLNSRIFFTENCEPLPPRHGLQFSFPFIRMKKPLLLILTLLVLGAVSSHAQSDTSSKKSIPIRWSLGICGGWAQNHHVIDMAYQTDIQYDKTASGYTAGLQSYCHFSNWFALRADLVWVQKNYNMTHNINYYSIRENVSTQTTNDYLSVPLVAVFSVGKAFRLQAFGGGYVGYWLRSHRKGQSYSMTYSMYDEKESNTFDEDMEFSQVRDNRFDAGLTWGAGLSGVIAKKIEIGAEIRWYYGLTDIQKQYMKNLNPRYNTTMVIQGGVGYWF